MAKALVIVESPAKAKTINQYLGKEYVVKSSVGHIRDLPTNRLSKSQNKDNRYKKKDDKHKKTALINRIGIDPWQSWEAHYQILPGKEKIVSELKTLADQADHIYLATDLDREGEAIAWHLREVIGGNTNRFSRIIFNEITKNAILQALKNPIQINIDRVNAQQARRFMDRIVGYMLSPLLWKKIARGLSAGRVQSVAVRLIVEREHQIKTFLPKEYWKIIGEFLTSDNQVLSMQLNQKDGKTFRIVNYKQAQELINYLKSRTYSITDRQQKVTNYKPYAPFTTSTLQQAASTHLNFSVKKTMMIAQRLYETGYITYIRTDSTNLSQPAVEMARIYIQKKFGTEYLPNTVNIYINKKKSQEAHEAIRPCDVNIEVNLITLKKFGTDFEKLYKLIFYRFIACQMVPAKQLFTSLIMKINDIKFITTSSTTCFDGWKKLIPAAYSDTKDEHKLIDSINIGESLILKDVKLSQHFSKPPLRFNEASLVHELEKLGIGRPSTYALIISTIQERGYVRVENHRFYAEKMGEIVTQRLRKNFSELMDYNFTAYMENNLDKIANNQAAWKDVLNSFFKRFSEQLTQAEKDPEEGGMQPNNMMLTTINCTKCTRKMGIRITSTGIFLGCSGYNLPSTERCKQTINLIPQNQILNILKEDNKAINTLQGYRRCQKCQSMMDSYITENQKKINICGNHPQCHTYEIEEGIFNINNDALSFIECEKCHHTMHFKVGRFGKYMACNNEHCKNTRKILYNGKIASPKREIVSLPELRCQDSSAFFVLRQGSSGVFLAANTFPKSRETRAPFIEELKRFVNRLPKELKYLAEAPAQDITGNKTILRFHRKTKEQYITSEKKGKSTGWSMFYIDGKWQEKKINIKEFGNKLNSTYGT